MPDRFYVIECEGTDIDGSEHVQARNYPRSSLTCTVLDRVFAHREVRSFRTEAGRHGQRGQVRKRAAAEAARLNASVR
jgi:hypothetical protein